MTFKRVYQRTSKILSAIIIPFFLPLNLFLGNDHATLMQTGFGVEPIEIILVKNSKRKFKNFIGKNSREIRRFFSEKFLEK
jgi:hypothetical protein